MMPPWKACWAQNVWGHRPANGATAALTFRRFDIITHYHLAVVSDAQSVYGLPELRATGLAGYFSPIIISGDYGYRKPDPRLFQAALQALRVSPEEAIFIGNDRLRDVYGARQVGMKTILFCPNGVPSGSPETEPEYVLCGYNDLPRAIQFLSGS
jgi:putative hydrolase of the HAD superfamily